ncbi:MAG: zinc ribbon domain-containing protein [Candidatus Obscuribacterales bacterium]|nr:zinc ribbon domain-containing protein [Candidatus Obscuribacterales bacterium]
MTYASATVNFAALKPCSNCNEHIEAEAKFCGGCGFIVAPNSFNIHKFPEQASRLQNYEEALAEVPQSMPGFARPNIVAAESPKANEYNAEASKLMVLLARERIFLYSHLLTFLAINLFGCWVAWKCYYDFIGDEMSKMMIASTPFLFINSLALLMIVPIKGTRGEIARLKERLSYVRFNIEFGHLKL